MTAAAAEVHALVTACCSEDCTHCSDAFVAVASVIVVTIGHYLQENAAAGSFLTSVPSFGVRKAAGT